MNEVRRTGLSTAQALESLARAIRFPGEWFKAQDHAGDEHPMANRMLFDRIHEMARLLGLHFEFKFTNKTFRSMHYGIEIDRKKHRFRQLPKGEWVQQ